MMGQIWHQPMEGTLAKRFSMAFSMAFSRIDCEIAILIDCIVISEWTIFFLQIEVRNETGQNHPEGL